MICNKCAGYAFYEPYKEFIGYRCMNCGKRFNVFASIESTEFDRFMAYQYTQRWSIVKDNVRACEFCKTLFSTQLKFMRFCRKKCSKNAYWVRKRVIKPVYNNVCEFCKKQFTTSSTRMRHCNSNCVKSAYLARRKARLAKELYD